MTSTQKRVACISQAALMILGLLSLCICPLGSITLRKKRIAKQRRIEQEEVNETIRTIRDLLYVPTDAVVLDEVQTNYHLADYPPDCIGSAIEITYGINRSFDEVLTEYHYALLGAGWTLHPGYRQSEDYAVYSKGPQVELSINNLEEREPLLVFTPTPMPPAARQFTTIYRITITYTEPSNRECVG